MIIGLDFDNTIVNYDEVFHSVALKQGVTPAGLPHTKNAVRSYLRESGQEKLWTELQGEVYGLHMDEAATYPGFSEFIACCRREKARFKVISHKTCVPCLGPPHDLRAAALRWLMKKRIELGWDIAETDIFFEDSQSAKMVRIVQSACDGFVDDLPEFICIPEFPTGIKRILFDPNGQYSHITQVPKAESWGKVADLLF